ncbi:hypothetical protein OAM69_05440 [bacterium]|nr:hypothetical protein [bacterium]
MSWQILKLDTYWTAEEAATVLTLIDELRDQIINTYGDQIVAMRTAELDTERNEVDERQTQLPLEPEDF